MNNLTYFLKKARLLILVLISCGLHASLIAQDTLWDELSVEHLRQLILTQQPVIRFAPPQVKLAKPKTFVQVDDAAISYLLNYRSNIDTPFVETTLTQHNISGSAGITLANLLPVKLLFWSRQSNSHHFRDITDVQLSFNRDAFRRRLQEQLRSSLQYELPAKDSLLASFCQLKQQQLNELKQWLQHPLQKQRLIEANEIIKVPDITFDPSLPEALNQQRADSIRQKAKDFLELYKATMARYDTLDNRVDSLQQLYDEVVQRTKKLKQLLDGSYYKGDWSKLEAELSQAYGARMDLPSKYRWLSGIRNVSVGRAPVNYSELTAKNVGINGINFEYNSWYYFAVTAGVVDYRFRDFALSRTARTPQHLYMLRLGIGTLEKSYLIASAYRGQKQLYAVSEATRGVRSIDISGYGLEGKWQLTPNSYFIAEIGESQAPDYRSAETSKRTAFRLSDKSNKGVSLKVFTRFPRSNTSIEGMYKYTGANFQSFSSFQSNAAITTWNVKGEQYLFGRMLKLAAALKQNEFDNPYLVQNYNSNTLLKSFSATFRKKKWPVVSLGYIPMSQLTTLDDQVVETRFQTFNGTISHSYQLAGMPLATSMVYNKFYNRSADAGFAYYNATNLFLSQQLFFHAFTLGLSVSHTKNNTYELNVMDENIQWNIGRIGTVGGGAKITNLSRTATRLGGYINATVKVFKDNFIYMSYESGYLPGFAGGLIRNDMATIQYTKRINFN